MATQARLDDLVQHINHLVGAKPGKPGSYCLDRAYGGQRLVYIINDAGGQACPLGLGRYTKRELEAQLMAFIAGIRVARGVEK